MTEHFGRGIYVVSTEDDSEFAWDLDTDESGDLRTVDNSEDELLKDVAFRSAINLSEDREDEEGETVPGVLGRPLTPTTMNRIRSTVKQTLQSEPRIRRIVSLDVREVPSNSNAVEVNAQVTANDTMVTLIFMVED